jgi:hypothetical protein
MDGGTLGGRGMNEGARDRRLATAPNGPTTTGPSLMAARLRHEANHEWIPGQRKGGIDQCAGTRWKRWGGQDPPARRARARPFSLLLLLQAL